MISEKEWKMISWATGDQPMSAGQKKAVEKFFDKLSLCQRAAVDSVEVYPGEIVGLTQLQFPIVAFLYDADTGDLEEWNIKNLIRLPENNEIHLERKANE